MVRCGTDRQRHRRYPRQTLDGFPAIYDADLGLFCYARIRSGRYESTKTPITGNPPDGVEPDTRRSQTTRAAKIDERRRAIKSKDARKDVIR